MFQGFLVVQNSRDSTAGNASNAERSSKRSTKKAKLDKTIAPIPAPPNATKFHFGRQVNLTAKARKANIGEPITTALIAQFLTLLDKDWKSPSTETHTLQTSTSDYDTSSALIDSNANIKLMRIFNSKIFKEANALDPG